MVGIYGGTQAIYISKSKDAVRKAADQDAGHVNITFIRPATEAEVEWHEAMGGRIEVVDPAP